MRSISRQNSLSIYQPQQMLKQCNNKVISKCKHAETDSTYFLQTYIFDTLPHRIQTKMEHEIACLEQLGISNLSKINQAFIYRAEEKTRICTVSKFIHSKSLKTLILSKQYQPTNCELFQHMRQIIYILVQLHQLPIIHGNITLDSLFYQQPQHNIAIGRPRLHQIHKYQQPSLSNCIATAPEITKGYTANFASDIWQLGVVFLQLALKEFLEEKSINKKHSIAELIGKVQNASLREFLKQMLADNPRHRPNSKELLVLLEKAQKNELIAAPSINGIAAFFRVIQIDAFAIEPKIIGEKVVREQEVEQARNTMTCFINAMQNQQLLTIKVNNKKIKNIEIQIAGSKFFQDLLVKHRSMPLYGNIICRQTDTGIISLCLLASGSPSIKSIKPVFHRAAPNKFKQLIWNNEHLVHNRGSINGGKAITHAIVLSENLVLAALPQLYDAAKGKQITNLSFRNQNGSSFEIANFYFPHQYREDKFNLHNSYCLIEFNSRVGSCNRFKRMIKNYNEQIIDALAAKNNIFYNYQIGDQPLRRGEVQFIRDKHEFRVLQNQKIIAGDVLTINFSNNNMAIVGLYIRNGRGITFDSAFYQRVYQWISSRIKLQDRIHFQFALTECSVFEFEASQMPNLDTVTRLQKIGSNAKILCGIEEHSRSNRPTAQLAQLLFDSILFHYTTGKEQAARESCRQAEQIFKGLFKLPVCSVVINFSMYSYLTAISCISSGNSNQEIYLFQQKCIEALQKWQLHPLMLATCYYRAAINLEDPLRSPELHQRSIVQCQHIHHNSLIKQNYKILIRKYNLPDTKVEQLYQQYQQYLCCGLLGDSPLLRFERIKLKINFFRVPHNFRFVNNCLREMLELVNGPLEGDQMRQREAKGVIKNYLVEFMSADISLQDLQNLEDVIRKSDENSYIHLKGTFRKKEANIKKCKPQPSSGVQSNSAQTTIENNKYLLQNRGVIKGGKTGPSRSIFLSELIVLTALPNIFDDVSGKVMTKLTLQSQTNYFIDFQNIDFPSQYANDKSLHNSYCIVKTDSYVVGSCAYFKRLIKNYDEATIHTLASSNQVYYNYQLGEDIFRRGEIQFDRERNEFKIKGNKSFAPGEPLTLNFSNNNFAIVGLHICDGKGITFNNQFAQRVFNWITKYDQFYIFQGIIDFQFDLIDCGKFELQRSEIPCISGIVNTTILRQNLGHTGIITRMEELSRSNNDSAELGLLLFESRNIYLAEHDVKTAKENCKKAAAMFERLFKLPICKVAINYCLSTQLFARGIEISNQGWSFDKTGLLKECYQMMQKCIDVLEPRQLNPVLLANCFYRAAYFLNDPLLSPDLHQRSIRYCQQTGHIALLNMNYNRMLIKFKLTENKIEQLYLNYEKYIYGGQLGDTPELKLERIKLKIDFLKQSKRYSMINNCLKEMLLLAGGPLEGNEELQKQMKDIMRNYLVEFMKDNIQLQDLLNLKEVISKYDEDTYFHLRETFRVKEEIINKSKQPNSKHDGKSFETLKDFLDQMK